MFSVTMEIPSLVTFYICCYMLVVLVYIWPDSCYVVGSLHYLNEVEIEILSHIVIIANNYRIYAS